MYLQIDKSVEEMNPDCFEQCGPQPYNMTSDCYLQCFSETTTNASQEQLVAPWYRAFDGACPEVPIVVEGGIVRAKKDEDEEKSA